MDLLSFLLGTAGAAGAYQGLERLREYRRRPAGLADLLLWGFLVEEGVVLQKDGSLLAGWRYRGPDLESATSQEISVLSRQVREAFLPYGERWMFHVDAIRGRATNYAPRGAFPDPVTALIDEERRAAHTGGRAHYETEYFLTVTYLPPREVYSRLGRYFVQGDLFTGDDWDQVLGRFSHHLTEFSDRLGRPLALERLSSGELLTFLHRCLTGLAHPVTAPAHGSYLNHVLSDQELLGGIRPRIGDLHIRPVALHGFPRATSPGGMDFLNKLGLGYRWSSRFLPLSTQQAHREIRRRQIGWFNKRKGALALVRDMMGGHETKDERTREDEHVFVDAHAQQMAADTQAASAANASGQHRFGYHTCVVLAMEPSARAADAAAQAIMKTARDHGYAARLETVNALEAYLGSLPGHGHPNIRKPLLSSVNMADMLPVTSVWPGLPANPSPYFPPDSPPLLWAETEGTTPFRINLHDGDVGHTLMIGATGAGKSVAVNMLIAQWFRYPEAQAFLFDLGYSGYLLARAAGATYYEIGAGGAGGVQFQPLARIDDPIERSWAGEWLEVLLGLQGVAITPGERRLIGRALELVATSPPEHRTLTELSVQVQSPALKEALRPYTVEGHLGFLLDGTADGFRGGRYQVFECKHLMDLSEKAVVPVLLHLFRRIDDRLAAGRPTLIVIEEAWAALMQTLFADRIRQWLLTLRKQNAAVVLVAHSPAQLAGLEGRHVILESCPTRIFLPNPDASDPDTARLYESFGLNRSEIERIARARKKRDYYFSSPSGSRQFSLGLGPVALAFLGARPGQSLPETIHEARAMPGEGAAWAAAWLRRCGLEDWGDQLATTPNQTERSGHESISPAANVS